jgi:hypothetical protein
MIGHVLSKAHSFNNNQGFIQGFRKRQAGTGQVTFWLSCVRLCNPRRHFVHCLTDLCFLCLEISQLNCSSTLVRNSLSGVYRDRWSLLWKTSCTKKGHFQALEDLLEEASRVSEGMEKVVLHLSFHEETLIMSDGETVEGTQSTREVVSDSGSRGSLPVAY